MQRPSNVTANHERHCQSRTCHGACYAVERAFAVGSLFAYHALGALHARALRSWSLISWISVRGYTGAGVKCALSLEDQQLMTLMRLRLEQIEQELAYTFGINVSTVSKTVKT